MPAIVRKARMNRVYLTGDVEQCRDLLSDFRARHDESGWWLPIRMEHKLRAALEKESEYQATVAAALAGWNQAKSAIPSDYKIRHGAAFGGDVRIDGEMISEPGLRSDNLPWQRIATHERRVRDLTGQSSINGRINGRISDSDTLYGAALPDGRTIHRIAYYGSFGDDQRETYYLPPDLWERLMAAEVRMRGITREAAEKWLAEYRGCVGTELYEYALSAQLSAK